MKQCGLIFEKDLSPQNQDKVEMVVSDDDLIEKTIDSMEGDELSAKVLETENPDVETTQHHIESEKRTNPCITTK